MFFNTFYIWKIIYIEYFYRAAVQNCQEDDDEGAVLSSEEKQKLFEAKQNQIRQIVGMFMYFWNCHNDK